MLARRVRIHHRLSNVCWLESQNDIDVGERLDSELLRPMPRQIDAAPSGELDRFGEGRRLLEVEEAERSDTDPETEGQPPDEGLREWTAKPVTGADEDDREGIHTENMPTYGASR